MRNLMLNSESINSELISKELIFGLPTILYPKVSPNGKILSYLKKENDILDLWIRDEEKKDLRITNEKRSIFEYYWAYNNEDIIYLQDRDGDENWNIYKVNIYTKQTVNLTPFENVKAMVVKTSYKKPDEILIAMNKRDPRFFDYYRLNVRNGKLELILEAPENLIGGITYNLHGIIADDDLNIIGGHFVNDEGDIEIRYFHNGKWVNRLNFTAEESFLSTAIQSYSKDKVYLCEALNSKTFGISLFNIETGQIKRIASDQEFDVFYILVDNYHYEPLAYALYKEKLYWIPLKNEIEEDIKFLSSQFEDDYFIENRDMDDNYWIVSHFGDYYLYKRKEKELEFLFESIQGLKNYGLSKKEPYWIYTEDNIKILVYLTFPVKCKRENLPMVVLVHGGPWSRDNAGFDKNTIWLSNRGYLCLQVNFRGSIGFGKDFLNAGDKEWGGKIYEDVIAAVKRAIKEGYADKNRIAIMGHSFGGYISLLAAGKNSDIFKCAISINGLTDLIYFLNTIPSYWTTYKKIFDKKIGNVEKDKELLISQSPFSYIENMNLNLLIFQGERDPRVKKEQNERIVEILKQKGKNVKYVTFPDEGHSIMKQQNRIKMYEEIEKFLYENL